MTPSPPPPSVTNATTDAIAPLRDFGWMGTVCPDPWDVLGLDRAERLAQQGQERAARWTREAVRLLDTVRTNVMTPSHGAPTWRDNTTLARLVASRWALDRDAELLAAWSGWWAREQERVSDLAYVVGKTLLLLSLGAESCTIDPMVQEVLTDIDLDAAALNNVRVLSDPFVGETTARARFNAVVTGLTLSGESPPRADDIRGRSGQSIALWAHFPNLLTAAALGVMPNGSPVLDQRHNRAVRTWLEMTTDSMGSDAGAQTLRRRAVAELDRRILTDDARAAAPAAGGTGAARRM